MINNDWKVFLSFLFLAFCFTILIIGRPQTQDLSTIVGMFPSIQSSAAGSTGFLVWPAQEYYADSPRSYGVQSPAPFADLSHYLRSGWEMYPHGMSIPTSSFVDNYSFAPIGYLTPYISFYPTPWASGSIWSDRLLSWAASGFSTADYIAQRARYSYVSQLGIPRYEYSLIQSLLSY